MMRPKVTKSRRPIGRPPAGVRAGNRVKNYPPLSIRLPSDVKPTLQAISIIASRPQGRIITDAIECYLRERSDAERRMVDELVGRSRARAARGRRVTES